MKLRKSLLNDFEMCPQMCRAVWVDGIQKQVGQAALIGRDFHEFVFNFFDLVDYEHLKKFTTEKDVTKYFMSFVDAKNSRSERYMTNFCAFEAAHFINLRDLFNEDTRRYFFPKAREVHFESDNFSGTIDRVDYLTDGTLIVIEYKTGRSFNASDLRREITFYGMVANMIRLFKERVTQGGVYNAQLNQFWNFDLAKATIDAINRRIRALNECVKTGNWPTQISGICRYCPIANSCSALQKIERIDEEPEKGEEKCV